LEPHDNKVVLVGVASDDDEEDELNWKGTAFARGSEAAAMAAASSEDGFDWPRLGRRLFFAEAISTEASMSGLPLSI